MAADIVLLGGNSNQELVVKISTALNVPVSKALISQYADQETRVELHENMRGNDVYVIQSTCTPANHHIMEALIIIDACKRASAKTITFVAPYFGYARQERKSAPRTPITAKLVADLLETAGADRVLTLELHNSAIQGFFNVPVDNLFIKPIFAKFLKTHDYQMVISPDAGGVERARAIAKYLNCGLGIIDKRRERPNESSVIHIIGEVEGKKCLIIDDIVDTAGSLVNSVEALLKHGARGVDAAITHPVLSQNAIDKIEHSELGRLITTDSIPLSAKAKECPRIVQVSIAELIAESIKRIHEEDSISTLFV